MERLNICRTCNEPKVGDFVDPHRTSNGKCPVCGRENFGSMTSYYVYVHLNADNKIEAIASLAVLAVESVTPEYANTLKQAGWSFKQVLEPNFEPDYGQEIFRDWVILAWKNFALNITLHNPLTLNTLFFDGANDEQFDEANELLQTGSTRLFKWGEEPPPNPEWEAIVAERNRVWRAYHVPQPVEHSDLPF